MRTVLVSGASMAGPALAYWLNRAGFRVTVVEKAPGIRPGGQAIDIRGVALDVTERMGLLSAVRAAHLGMRGMTVVDADGEELFSTTERTMSSGLTDSGDVELLRDRLCDLLYGATRDQVEYIFGDSIRALNDRGDEGPVEVTFERSAPGSFDLVIGADGLHSHVRRLAFGDERPYRTDLGLYAAVFSIPNLLDLDRWQVIQHGAEGRLVGVLGVHATEVRAYLLFPSEDVPDDRRDPDTRRAIVAERFGSDGWVVPQLLEAMWDAPDFHFDSASQIHMPHWSTGRVGLIGDAAYSGSLLSGQGTSVALVAAYVLAGELAVDSDHTRAFAAYRRRLQDWVQQNQQLAIMNIRRRIEARGEDPDQVEGPTIEGVKRAFTLPEYGLENAVDRCGPG